MMSTLIKLVEAAASLVKDWALQQVEINDTGMRDNGFAIFENAAVRFRIESEQGNPSLEVASQLDPENWFDVSLLLNLKRSNNLLKVNNFNELVEFARHDSTVIIEDFTVDFEKTKLRLATAEKARFRLMFPSVPID